MKSTAQKLILISFVLALSASVVAFLYLQSLKSPKAAVKKITIVVAAETIPARTLVDKKMLKEIKVEDNSIYSNYIKDSSKIVGKYTKETVLKDEGFQSENVISKDAKELSLKIDDNYRAVSISVTGDTGVSDLLEPGDYVDIIAYVAEKKDGQTVVNEDIAKTILQNIELVAVDKQLDRKDSSSKTTTSATSSSTSSKENTITNFLITVAVPVADVEKLVLAESIGKIKIALRPIKDDKTTDTNGVTRDELSINDAGTSSGQSSDTDNKDYTSYTVAKGDTLKKISKAFYGDEKKYTIIRDYNNIKKEDLIIPGEIIKIPTLQK